MGECFSLRRGGALAPPIHYPTTPKDPTLDALEYFSVFVEALHAGTHLVVQSLAHSGRLEPLFPFCSARGKPVQ